VECGNEASDFFNITKGTVQGSVLGPILFSIFIAPIKNETEATAFADDSYIIVGNKDTENLKRNLQKKLADLHTRFKNSGM